MKKIIFLILSICILEYVKAQNTNPPTSGITGGTQVTIQDIPYQAEIEVKSNNTHRCGCSIINNRYVLTAAHCVEGWTTGELRVKAGFDNISAPGTNLQSFDVANIYIHPNRNTVTKDFDVALIEISGFFSFNSFVQPIELYYDQNSISENVNRQVEVSGWGWTQPGVSSASNELLAVEVPIIANQTASSQLDVSFSTHPPLSNQMIATGSVGAMRSGACNGDSGSPLVDKETGLQIGIVSWGVPNCVGGTDSPSIYARVSQFVNWIDNIAWNSVKLDGNPEVCFSTSNTYSLVNSTNFNLVSSWSVSPNLQISNSFNNQIDIKPISNSEIGTGWIEATLQNGVVVKRNLRVGVPDANLITVNTTGNGIYLAAKTWQEVFGFSSFSDSIEWGFTQSVLTQIGSPNSILVYPQTVSNSLTIRLRSYNRCGSSSWKDNYFTVIKSAEDGGAAIMH